MTTEADDLLRRGRHAGARIATAESCTGGMVAAAITDVPGSSDIFDRGFVTYTNVAKVELLGVQPATLQRYGAVSEAVVREMAEGALERSAATIAVSVSGIAGPGGSEFKPEGRVCFGLAALGQKTKTETVEFGAIGRTQVRTAATSRALALLIGALGASD